MDEIKPLDEEDPNRVAAEEFLDEVRQALRSTQQVSAEAVDTDVARTDHWWVKLAIPAPEPGVADGVMSALEENGLSAVPMDTGAGTVVERLARGERVKIIEGV
jgi:acetylornithine deacetylase/succinyl-diaminopimelate desuccinylase-like protein